MRETRGPSRTRRVALGPRVVAFETETSIDVGGSAKRPENLAETRAPREVFSRGARLTSLAPTLVADRSAPRVGFEPTTRRLTAGCSTVELSRNPSTYNLIEDARRADKGSQRHISPPIGRKASILAGGSLPTVSE